MIKPYVLALTIGNIHVKDSVVWKELDHIGNLEALLSRSDIDYQFTYGGVDYYFQQFKHGSKFYWAVQGNCAIRLSPDCLRFSDGKDTVNMWLGEMETELTGNNTKP